MAEFPVLPLFTDALLADTAHLTAQEFGAYIRILITAWRSPDCTVPDNDRMLINITRAHPGQWRRGLRQSLEPFFQIEGGKWRQKRLLKERARVSRASTARASGGYAKARKDKETRDANADLTLTIRESTNVDSKSSALAKPKKGRKSDDEKEVDILDWKPNGADRKYAEEHGLDAERVFTDIQDWAVNAKRAKRLKRFPSRFWQKWVRDNADGTKGRGGGTNHDGRGRGGSKSDQIRDAGRRFASEGDLG